MAIPANKLCPACKQILPEHLFSRNRASLTGLHTYCQKCDRAKKRKDREQNPEKYTKWRKAYYLKTRKERLEGTKRWCEEHPEQVKDIRYRKYGLTCKQVDEMRLTQENKCAICGALFEETPHVDHNHETRCVRGLLCRLCNVGLGAFRDDPVLLQRATNYLIKFKQKP